jgi:hypothetical protein
MTGYQTPTALRELTARMLSASNAELQMLDFDDPALLSSHAQYWRQQRVVPRIARFIASDPAFPDDWKRWAGDTLSSNAVKSLQHLERLCAISQLLADSDGIDSIPIKGVVLSLLLYADPGARQCGDIDLLVPAERFDDAVLLVQRHGYTQRSPAHFTADGRLKPSYRPHRNDAGLLDPSGSFALELHHRLCKYPGLLPDDYDEVRAAAVPVEAGGITFMTPGPEILLAYLAVHAMFSRWGAMKWFLDLPAVVDRFGPDAVEAAYDRARQRGFLPLLDAALTLGNRLVGRDAPVPRGPRKRCAWLVDQVWRRLADGSYAVENRRDPLQLAWFRLHLLEGAAPRARMAKINLQSLVH